MFSYDLYIKSSVCRVPGSTGRVPGSGTGSGSRVRVRVQKFFFSGSGWNFRVRVSGSGSKNFFLGFGLKFSGSGSGSKYFFIGFGFKRSGSKNLSEEYFDHFKIYDMNVLISREYHSVLPPLSWLFENQGGVRRPPQKNWILNCVIEIYYLKKIQDTSFFLFFVYGDQCITPENISHQ